MHVRINIPAWGGQEMRAGLSSLAPWRDATRSLEALRGRLRSAAPGWEPHLVRSARQGLAMAVARLGLEGRRIAVPGYVCPAALAGLRLARAEAVGVDCEPCSTRFDLEALARLAREGLIDAVLAVNTYGIDQDFRRLSALGLPVLEDAAYQAGRRGAEGLCGTRGQAGVWSFSFKALCGPGGGVLWTRHGAGESGKESPSAPRARPEELRRFADYALRAAFRYAIPRFLGGARPPESGPPGARPDLLAERAGRMSALQAAVIGAQWDRREGLAALQRQSAAALAEALAGSAVLRPLTAPVDAVHLLPCLLGGTPTPGRIHALRLALYRHGVQTEDPYPVLLGGPEALPQAHALASRLVLLPCHVGLDGPPLRHVAAAVAEAVREAA